MKRKNLQWAQRESEGKAKLARLLSAVKTYPKNMSARQNLRIVRSENRQRAASKAAKDRRAS